MTKLNEVTSGSRMQVLEMEDVEEDAEYGVWSNGNGGFDNASLLQKETNALNPGSDRHQIRQRRHATDDSESSVSSPFVSVQGFLRGGVTQIHRFTSNRLFYLFALAAAVFAFLLVENHLAKTRFKNKNIERSEKKPHDIGLGSGAKQSHFTSYDPGIGETPSDLFDETDMTATLGKPNQDNIHGHFWHNPYKSPYASVLYRDQTDESRSLDQQQFDNQRQLMLQTYGGYTPPPDDSHSSRYTYNYPPYNDVEAKSFPHDSWQNNGEYQELWLKEASDLVLRVQRGIYAEYGEEFPESQSERLNGRLGVFVGDNFNVPSSQHGTALKDDGKRIATMAYLSSAAWDGLIRKLTHALMTHSEFYVVAVGPASHTYLGNNFFESHIHQFNYIMEPVFQRLGVQLISRNMGMEASTIVSSLGGSSIYGEADILWYTGPAESVGAMDLLQRQAIMSGQRVPLLLTPLASQEMRDAAWIGNIQPGTDVCSSSEQKQLEGCRYLNCPVFQNCKKFRSKCWVSRTNVTDPDGQRETLESSSVTYAEHKLAGRKLTLMVLQALEEALNQWNHQLVEKQNPPPLHTDHWHVTSAYREVRSKVQSTSGIKCRVMLEAIDPGICNYHMHALTEWTPRANHHLRLKNIIERETLSDNSNQYAPLYGGVDLRPLDWKLPAEAVDVHMIAIATNATLHEIEDEYDVAGCAADVVMDDDSPVFEHNGRVLRAPVQTGRQQENISRSILQVSGNREMIQLAKKKWTIHNAPLGYCDGSAQSMCNRAVGNDCLLANINHYKAMVVGHSESGWLEFARIPKLEQGILLLRFDRANSALPEDFSIQFSLRGEGDKSATMTMNEVEFKSAGVELAADLIVHPLHTAAGKSFMTASPLQISLKFTGGAPGDFALYLTHIYFA